MKSLLLVSTALLFSTAAFAQVTGAAGTASTATSASTAGANITTNTMGSTGTTGQNSGVGTVNSRVTASSGMDWNSQNTYWRDNYASRPYAGTRSYSTYEPAYRYGVETYNRNQGKRYEDLSQDELNRGWTQARGSSSMNWNDAQQATRDSYNRLYENRASATSGSATTGTTR